MEPIDLFYYAMIWTGANRRAKLLYGPYTDEDSARLAALSLFSYWDLGVNEKELINENPRGIVDAKYGRLYREYGRGNRGYFVDGPSVVLHDVAGLPVNGGALLWDKTDLDTYIAEWNADNTDPETLECFGPMIDDFCVDCTDVDEWTDINTNPYYLTPLNEYYQITVSPYSPPDLVDDLGFKGYYNLVELRQDEIDAWISAAPKVINISQIVLPGQFGYDDSEAVLAVESDIQLDTYVSDNFMVNKWFGRYVAGQYRSPPNYIIQGNDTVYTIDNADEWLGTQCSAGFQWGFSTYVPFWTGEKLDQNVDRYLDHWYVVCELFAQVGSGPNSDSARSYYSPDLQGTDDFNRFPALGGYGYVEPIYDSIFSGQFPPDTYFFGKSWTDGISMHFHKPVDGDGDNVAPWCVGVRFSVKPFFRVAGKYGDCDLIQEGEPFTCTILGRSKREHVIGEAGTEPGQRFPRDYNPTGAEKFSSAPWDLGLFVDTNPTPANGPTTTTNTRHVLRGWSAGGKTQEELAVLNEWLGPDFLANVKTFFRLPGYRKMVAFMRILNGFIVNPDPLYYEPSGAPIYPFPVIIDFDGAEGTPDPRGNPIYGDPVFGDEELQQYTGQNGVA